MGSATERCSVNRRSRNSGETPALTASGALERVARQRMVAHDWFVRSSGTVLCPSN
jgi:hypothetical protein